MSGAEDKARAAQAADPDSEVGGVAADRLRSIIERIERGARLMDARAPLVGTLRGDVAAMDAAARGVRVWCGVVLGWRRFGSPIGEVMPLDASIVFGNHGQSESANTREGYLAEYMAWITNYETASNGVLGGSTPLKFCMDSLASGAGGNPPQAALALVDAARAYPNRVHIGCVYHWFNNNDALVKFGLVDDVHLRPLGYALRGEYWGKWYVHHVVQGLPWTGLLPAAPQIELDGLNWRVPIHKQDGKPLMFDTVSVPMAPNYGLRVSPVSGAPTLSNLAIDNDTSPTVAYFKGTFSSNPSGRTLAYAMFGSGSTLVGRPYAWGNVRNTRTEQSLVIPGLALNDWAAPWSFAIP